MTRDICWPQGIAATDHLLRRRCFTGEFGRWVQTWQLAQKLRRASLELSRANRLAAKYDHAFAGQPKSSYFVEAHKLFGQSESKREEWSKL